MLRTHQPKSSISTTHQVSYQLSYSVPITLVVPVPSQRWPCSASTMRLLMKNGLVASGSGDAARAGATAAEKLQHTLLRISHRQLAGKSQADAEPRKQIERKDSRAAPQHPVRFWPMCVWHLINVAAASDVQHVGAGFPTLR